MKPTAAWGAVAFLAAQLLQAQPAAARSDDCLFEGCSTPRPSDPSLYNDRRSYRRGRHEEGPREPSLPGRFDFYVLSLSWSPGFCASGGDLKSDAQCRVGTDLGFVIHGLWPQYDHGYPSDCRGGGASYQALAKAASLYPDEGLARYEWRKHGTCSGLSPLEYFADVKEARDAVTVPPVFKELRGDRRMSPVAVERAFIEANPRLHQDMVAATCRDGVLEEVRICFSKDLQSFQPCPSVADARCHSETITVPSPR